MSVGTADDVLSENFVENETERSTSTLRVEEEGEEEMLNLIFFSYVIATLPFSTMD